VIGPVLCRWLARCFIGLGRYRLSTLSCVTTCLSCNPFYLRFSQIEDFSLASCCWCFRDCLCKFVRQNRSGCFHSCGRSIIRFLWYRVSDSSCFRRRRRSALRPTALRIAFAFCFFGFEDPGSEDLAKAARLRQQRPVRLCLPLIIIGCLIP